MKGRWLVVTLLFAALALGITGGAVLAQEPVTSGGAPVKSFAARVAAKLGLDEAQVQGAFNQAARDIQNEAQQQKLDRMVAPRWGIGDPGAGGPDQAVVPISA